jgi:hypothetical protein
MSADEPQKQDTQRMGSPRAAPIEDDAPRVEQEVLTIPPEWVGMKLKSNAELDAEATAISDRQTGADPRPSTLATPIAAERSAHPIWMLAVIALAVGLLLLVVTRLGVSPPHPTESPRLPSPPTATEAAHPSPTTGPAAPTPRSSSSVVVRVAATSLPPSNLPLRAAPSASSPRSPSTPLVMPSTHPSIRPTPAPTAPSPRWEFVDPRSDDR